MYSIYSTIKNKSEKRGKNKLDLLRCMYTYIYIYMLHTFTYIYIHTTHTKYMA